MWCGRCGRRAVDGDLAKGVSHGMHGIDKKGLAALFAASGLPGVHPGAGGIEHAAGVAPLVVVPGQDLDQHEPSSP